MPASQQIALDRGNFKEDEHPRDKSGKFGSGSASSASAKESGHEAAEPKQNSGEATAKKLAAKAKKIKLTAAESGWVDMYSSQHFHELNSNLRSGKDGGAFAKGLDGAIAKQTLPEGTQLYRGMSTDNFRSLIKANGLDGLTKGAILEDAAFGSSSTSSGMASMYANAEGSDPGVVLSIKTGSGQKGLDMAAVADNKAEAEVLLPRGTKYRLVSYQKAKAPGQKDVFHVETVADGGAATDRIVGDEMPYDIGRVSPGALAFDRALASARTKDDAGHLHVADVPISKAAVNEYLGREIPDCDKLGLDPNRRYKLLRDPDEMAKGAASFNGKPLLNLHKPQLAADHDHDLTVGSVSGVYFDAPFLRAKDFAVWDGESIADIEQEKQRELSAAYFFDADMTPGVYEGVRYDGVMRNLRGNHVALVTKGRAGPDCIVSDSALPERKKPTMAKITAPKSRRGLTATAALSAYLRPKLAMDAAVDVGAIVKGVTAKNWKTSKPKIIASLNKATAGKLAQDATLEDITDMLDQLEEMVDEMPDEPVAAAASEPPAEDDNDGDVAKLKALLKSKGVSDEEIEKALGDTPDAPAMDDKTAPKPEEKKDVVTKPAMDAAIALARTETAAAIIAQQKAIRVAESDVRPIIGEIAMAQDSAADVYRLAMDHAKIPHEGVDPSAFPALIAMHKRHMADAPKQQRTPSVAMDAAAHSEREKRFPNGNRLGS